MEITSEKVLRRTSCSADRKAELSTSRNPHSVNSLYFHTCTFFNQHGCNQYLFASVRAFLAQKHTGIHRKRLLNKLMCHAFLSDISAKAQEGGCCTSLFLPLPVHMCLCETELWHWRFAPLYQSPASLVGVAASSESHEPLLCGPSDHLDRCPASTGRDKWPRFCPGSKIATSQVGVW